jgi:hypothetical protein
VQTAASQEKFSGEGLMKPKLAVKLVFEMNTHQKEPLMGELVKESTITVETELFI